MIEVQDCIDLVLKEMFGIVGLHYWKELTEEPDWFLEYSWTQEEEDEFVTWLTEVLHKNLHIRQAIAAPFIKTKKECRDAAGGFVMQYGWRREE